MMERATRVSNKMALLAGGIALILLLALARAAGAGAGEVTSVEAVRSTATVSHDGDRHPRANTYIKRTWGVELMYVRRTAAGYMLEFRYKVLDAEKAKPLFERQTKPVLTHAESGAKLVVPAPAKTGALRNSNLPIEGRVYWMFFANPGKLVKTGDHVSIQIGDFAADGLVVE